MQIAHEIDIDDTTAERAIETLIRDHLLELADGRIRLTNLSIDATALRPEEIMFRPRFQGIIEAAIECLDPAKGGTSFERSVFVMMAYDDLTNKLRKHIKDICQQFGLTARFTDDRFYAPQVWDNVICYALCSRYGIALFHKTVNKYSNVDYNPNVALEVGLMLAWGRSCCLLKDRSLSQLQSDLIGWLYHECDFSDPDIVTADIDKFFRDIGLNKDVARSNR